MNVTQLTRALTIGQTPLPMRVCYIIPSDAPAALLDVIFADCYQRWGGRDTLLLPYREGGIDEKYWAWAHAFDPDVVYSYVALDNILLDRVDRDLMPSAFELHRAFRDGDWTPHFREAPEPLQALSLLPYLASNRTMGPPRPLALLTKYMSAPVDPFVADSFGIAPFGPGWAQSEDVRRYADTLALGDRTQDHLRATATEDVPDTNALLRLLPDFRYEALTMAQVSGMGYDTYRHRLEPAWDTYNIVVGDSSPDRIAFWNARIGCDPYLRSRIIALRIPEARLDDEAFRAALVDFVARTNFPRGSGPAWAVIRSASVPAERLSDLVPLFAPRNVHALVQTFADLADCAATTPSGYPETPELDAQRYTESPIALRPVQPPHLKLWPVQRPMITGGAWVVQATFNRDIREYTGTDGTVRIPRRWAAVHAILTRNLAKATLRGGLRFPMAADAKPVRVDLISDDEQFVRSSLRSYTYLTTTEPRNALLVGGPQTHVQISAAGRQLLGFLTKIGDLESAFEVISDPFWQAVFAELAGPLGGATDEQIAEVSKRIKKRLGGQEQFKTEDDWESLAQQMVRLAPEVKAPPTRRRFSWFSKLYREHADELERRRAEEKGEAGIRAFASDRLTSLCNRGVFYQGYAWTCENCLHRNFAPVERLAPHLECSVCGHGHALRANFESHFQLDETISRGMRERGLRSVVWALGFLQASADHAFLFAPPLDLFINGARLTDLDIPCVVDGRLVIGEAKDSSRDVKQATSDKLIEAARVVRPDVVILACPDREAIDAVKKQVAYIQATLDDPRIEVRALTADDTQVGIPASICARGFWLGRPVQIVQFSLTPHAAQPAPGAAD